MTAASPACACGNFFDGAAVEVVEALVPGASDDAGTRLVVIVRVVVLRFLDPSDWSVTST